MSQKEWDALEAVLDELETSSLESRPFDLTRWNEAVRVLRRTLKLHKKEVRRT